MPSDSPKSGFAFPKLLLLLLLLSLVSCTERFDPLSLELKGSFQNFVNSVNEMHQKGLEISVFFPNTTDYKSHVQDLVIGFHNDVRNKGTVSFDPQGVVLSRLLGFAYHNYVIKEIVEIPDSTDVSMRISINFSYDKVISAAKYESGTRVFVPGKPLGRVYTLTMGEENKIPREQLSYIEIDTLWRATNHEGYWQLRECIADESSAQFVISLKDRF